MRKKNSKKCGDGMRLIDADSLLENYNLNDATKYGNKNAKQQNHSYSTMYLYEIADMIEDAPTIEAVPVENIKRIVDRLKKELYLADKAKERCNSLQFDVAKGYATGIYNAIEFVKEELSTLDICEYKCNLD